MVTLSLRSIFQHLACCCISSSKILLIFVWSGKNLISALLNLRTTYISFLFLKTAEKTDRRLREEKH